VQFEVGMSTVGYILLINPEDFESTLLPGRELFQLNHVRACSVIPIPCGLDGIGKNCERF
jgi:hypothetical protein